jgi:hypothetical protein
MTTRSFRISTPVNSLALNVNNLSDVVVGQQSERLFYVSTDTLYNTNSNVFGTIQAAVTAATAYQDLYGSNAYIVLPPDIFTEDFVIPRGSVDNGSLGGARTSILVFKSLHASASTSATATCLIKLTNTLELTRHIEFIGVSIQQQTADTPALKLYDNANTAEQIFIKLSFSAVYGNMSESFVPSPVGGTTPVIDLTHGLYNVFVFPNTYIGNFTTGVISPICIKFGSNNYTTLDTFSAIISGWVQLTGSELSTINASSITKGVYIGETTAETPANLGGVTLSNCVVGSSYINTDGVLATDKLVFTNCTCTSPTFITAGPGALGSKCTVGGLVSSSSSNMSHVGVTIEPAGVLDP